MRAYRAHQRLPKIDDVTSPCLFGRAAGFGDPVLPEKSEVAFPSRFYCERGASKTRVHALVRYIEGPDLISAVLTVVEEQAAFDVARLLNLSVREPFARGLDAEVERVAACLPAAPRASFREALQKLRSGTWPVERIADRERCEARSGRKPVNFKNLFPVPDCDHSESDDEDEAWCEKCEDFDFTPRSAAVLAEAFWQLGEEAADDIRVYGSDRVERGADWAVFDELPAVTWRLGSTWRSRFVQAAFDLAADLESGRRPLPRCTAEEMALHRALERAKEIVSDISLGEPLYADLAKHLPEDPLDYDWNVCIDVFLQDTDVLGLYSVRVSDSQPFGSELFAQALQLHPVDWFTTFPNMTSRERGR